jgi:hypothetical protein
MMTGAGGGLFVTGRHRDCDFGKQWANSTDLAHILQVYAQFRRGRKSMPTEARLEGKQDREDNQAGNQNDKL